MKEKWSKQIKEQAIAWSIGQIEAPKIDQVNILNASLFAMDNARQKLTVQPNYILIDGRNTLPNSKHILQKPIIKGDTKSAVITAASIIAKVYRDSLMIDYAKEYPEYAFDRNKGYPTKEHMAELENMAMPNS